MKRVFFLDIDGTILDACSKVTKYNIRALEQARKQGHKIFINTGRGKGCIPSPIHALPLDGIVSGCGCTVTVNDTDVYSACPSVETIHAYLQEIFSNGEHCFLEGENYLFRCNCTPEIEQRDSAYAKYCQRARLDYSIWTPLYAADEILSFPDARIPKLNLVGNYPQSELTRFAEHYDGVVDDFKCEMYSKGNSKATGMRYVMEQYFPGHESVAIGDSANDIEMLKAADISVAMGNAPKYLKKLCTITTDCCDNDGMGKAVLQLINN